MNGTKVKKVPKSTDLYKLHQIIGGIVGKRCWRVGFGYGGDLRLHHGARIAYGNPRMASQKKGEWRFATCGTTWELFTSKGLVDSRSGTERSLEKKAKILEGSRVANVEVSVPSNNLAIMFTNKCLFRIIPGTEDDKYDLPYWKLFMPDNMLVAFGPGKQWSCKPSDVPIPNEAVSSGDIGRK